MAALLWDLQDKGEVTSFNGLWGTTMPALSEYKTYGKVLFQIASEIPGSHSELWSEEMSDRSH
jgi:hypothetical protein